MKENWVMGSFPENMNEYRKQLQKGAIQQAYKGLMDYFMDLKAYFKSKYPDYYVSGSIYFGYMDMTYFSFFPESLKQRNLKIAVVFVHETFRFEVWLAGVNKTVQTEYWQLIKNSNWNKYHLAPTTKGYDSIIDHVLVENPDFTDLDALTKQIEQKTLAFIKDVEEFLTEHKEK
jgi:hypothetical protein